MQSLTKTIISAFFVMLFISFGCTKSNKDDLKENNNDSLALINNQKLVIDGIATYSGKEVNFGLVYQPTSGLFMISGGGPREVSRYPAFATDFTMTHNLKEGDIVSLVERNFTDLNGRARFVEALGYENDFWTENSVYSGKLTITSFDKKRRLFSADFQFKAVARTKYGDYLGERSIRGSLQNIFCIDATNGNW